MNTGRDFGTALQLALVFLRLGLTSFGGPVAHLSYFRAEFVEKRRWYSDADYADLVALCQFLPGPASSQVCFAIGLNRAGWAGGLAAWTSFTLPSAVVMLLFALGAGNFSGGFAHGLIDGLKILAVAVVASAVLGMGRTLCPDGPRLATALAAIVVLALWSSPLAQFAVILAGGLLGFAFGLGNNSTVSVPATSGISAPSSSGMFWLILTCAVFITLPLLLALGIGGHALAMFEAFYRAGSLVFGGGHVLLPLLESSVVGPGWITHDTFLTGYGAAQAIPGPLFTFAVYLGALSEPSPNGITGALIAMAGVSLPGLWLVAGAMPYWDRFRAWDTARSVLAGVNAAVVGVLAAALYDPVFVSGIRSPLAFAMAATAFFALTWWKTPVWMVVVATAVLGGFIGMAGW